MATLAIGKIALALKAYGFELRLWKEEMERTWGATLCDGDIVLDCIFEEDNLTLAKLYLLGVARERAMSQTDKTVLPGCDTFLNSWKPISRSKGQP
jgi:hypothetical protein